MASISSRVHKTFFAFSISSTLIMLMMVIMVNEDLESTMLQNDIKEEIGFMLARQSVQAPVHWESANLTLLLLPDSAGGKKELPDIFSHLPVPFNGEVEMGDKTFLVQTGHGDTGRYFIARNISAFEDRELLFKWILGAASMVMLVVTYFFAKIGSFRLTQPLKDLSQRMQKIPASQQMPRLDLNYQDNELQTIALTFNSFLGELEAFVTREQSLMSLASHELRTPIAVISGAVDILQRRAQLGTDDQKTVERIKNACNEMKANVEMLLTLSRRSESLGDEALVNLGDVLDEALEDLESRFDVALRVQAIKGEQILRHGDRTLVKMLLLNLVQNALQHTGARILIAMDAQKIEIQDEGEGLPISIKQQLSQNNIKLTGTSLPGLGLYIVTLICERLHWRLEVADVEKRGTLIRVHFG